MSTRDTPELTKEQQQALDANQGILQGSSYVLMRTDTFLDWFGIDKETLKAQLQEGFDQADRGELLDWDPERIKAEGRRRFTTA